MIKCPVKQTEGSARVAVGNDKDKQDIITKGYVKNLWKKKEFKNLGFPPVYLTDLIVSYGEQEELFLFWRHLGWRMNVDELLDNTMLDDV